MGAIEVHDVAKTFGSGKSPVVALDELSLSVDEGTVLGLLGPNGAGKTTTVRVLATLLAPDRGRASVLGHDVVSDADRVRRLIGLSGQFSAIDENLTGYENLLMLGRLYGLSRTAVRTRADELLEVFDLTDAAHRVAKNYSGGMKRRLDLSGALIARPPVLFLDEPTTGLDPRSRLDLWDVIRDRVRQGSTLLLTTQYLEEADVLADRIAVIDQGKVIAEGTSDELKDSVGGERIEVVVQRSDDADRARKLLEARGRDGVEYDEVQRRITMPSADGSAELVEVIREFDQHGISIADVGLRRPTLDDVFLALTGHASEGEPDRPEQGRNVPA